MPTGYTAYIEDGTIKTGKEFLKLCIRNFGCCISQRDEPLTAPLKTGIDPDSYYMNAVTKSRILEDQLKAMTPDDILRGYEHEINANIAKYRDVLSRKRADLAVYNRIEDEVEAWCPPTPDHNGIKEFALNQIEISKPSEREFMYDEEQLSNYENADHSMEAAKRWHEEKLKQANDDVEYYTKKMLEDKDRNKERWAFIQQFLESLDIIDEKKEA